MSWMCSYILQKPLLNRRCREIGWYVYRKVKNDIQLWLVKFQISPTLPIDAHRKGFMGFYGKHHRFKTLLRIQTAAEIHLKICVQRRSRKMVLRWVPRNKRSNCSILEDALIILTRSVRNVPLNLFNRFGGRKSRMISFLDENELKWTRAGHSSNGSLCPQIWRTVFIRNGRNY